MDFGLAPNQRQMISELEEVGRREFASKATRWDQNREYTYENLERLRAMGILGMTIPARFGGREQPLLDAILAIETVARYCGALGAHVPGCTDVQDWGRYDGGAVEYSCAPHLRARGELRNRGTARRA
jgi:alkylation response protein AidB-like acyl-CoA dehydrogenase